MILHCGAIEGIAVAAAQIAAVGEHQPADEGGGAAEKTIVDDVFEPVE